jgi:hypothetical protein
MFHDHVQQEHDHRSLYQPKFNLFFVELFVLHNNRIKFSSFLFISQISRVEFINRY